jgi:hypothetical protein
MTDRTPTTEAGRRLAEHHHVIYRMKEPELLAGILAIEDEARAPLVAAVRNVIDHLDRGMFSSAVMVDLPMLRAALSREARP